MAKAMSMTMSVPGVEVWINYLESNQRITTVEWTLPVAGVVARVRIYDIRQSEIVPIYDRTVAGIASGTESIPGNHRMIEVTDYSGTYWDLPAYIQYHINIETIG